MSSDKSRDDCPQGQARGNDEPVADDADQRAPIRRDRTPSIIVQSLELCQARAAPAAADSHEEEEAHNGSTSTTPSGNPSAGQEESSASPRGSLTSLHNSSCPKGNPSPVFSNPKQQQASTKSPSNLPGGTNRRLSLTIGSTAPRRLSLTVEGISSFINPAYKDVLTYSSGSATGSLRNKVALKPGHSLMGWVKLASTAKDLSGTNGKIIEVTPEELAKHDKEEDCWVAIKGNVYNVTTYLQYHPGGVEELMRGAGREITDLFNEVHCWVNYESILAKCLVGPYKLESPVMPAG